MVFGEEKESSPGNKHSVASPSADPLLNSWSVVTPIRDRDTPINSLEPAASRVSTEGSKGPQLSGVKSVGVGGKKGICVHIGVRV